MISILSKISEYFLSLETSDFSTVFPWFFYATALVFGILVGSFLNVLIFRIPKGEEFVKTSSHCMTCGHKLAWYDNIPLFSWLFLGGKCRYCKARISAQYPVIEALNGVIWLGILLINGINIDSFIYMAVSSCLIPLSVIDFRTYEIEDGFHFHFLALALFSLLVHYADWKSRVIGLFAVSIPLFIIYLVSDGKAIGGGDVKLMAVCGLLLGGWKSLIALGIGCIAGSVIHIIRMKVSKEGRVLAMGPYLSFGIMISMLFGDFIIKWYSGLL